MDVRIGTLDTTITLAGSEDLLDPASFERLVEATKRRVLRELERRSRREAESLGRRRIDPERY